MISQLDGQPSPAAAYTISGGSGITMNGGTLSILPERNGSWNITSPVTIR